MMMAVLLAAPAPSGREKRDAVPRVESDRRSSQTDFTPRNDFGMLRHPGNSSNVAV